MKGAHPFMKRYVLMRLFQALITFWILSIVIFIIGRATGDPISLMLPEDAGDEARRPCATLWTWTSRYTSSTGLSSLDSCKET
jgi:ABC-type dipeptide/oligopeptide/nickel transport system permease component